MGNVSIIKEAGTRTTVRVLKHKTRFDYPVEANGASAKITPAQNDLTIHLIGSPDETAANTLLTAIALPTCTHNLLAITVNVGTFLVNDITNVTADPTLIKFFLAKIVMNETTGALSIVVCEKITEEYPIPTDTMVANLKEYSLEPAGTALVEIKDHIL